MVNFLIFLYYEHLKFVPSWAEHDFLYAYKMLISVYYLVGNIIVKRKIKKGENSICNIRCKVSFAFHRNMHLVLCS